MTKKIITTTLLSFTIAVMFAQIDMNYWDRIGYFKMGGGIVTPGVHLGSSTDNGLFAKNGYQVNFDYNYMFGYGLGIGANLEFDGFKFNSQAFVDNAGAEEMVTKGGYSSTKFGLNALLNIPVVMIENKLALNLYGEFNAGIRGFNIPSIDLYFDELTNKYIEVNYRSRSNTMGYLGYSAGAQILFKDRFGINVSYNAVLPSRHSLKYSVRMTDAFNEVTEEENYLNNFLDHTGLQFGIMFIFGK